jgi:hypothetical protein
VYLITLFLFQRLHALLKRETKAIKMALAMDMKVRVTAYMKE